MTISPARVRRLALAQPRACEADHHGFPSFRISSKIFATLPDEEHLHVMIGEDEIRALTARDPEAYEEFRWGKRLACLRVALDRADPDQVAELLADAWSRKAPRRLAQPPRPDTT